MQDKLKQKIKSFNLDTLPHSILLLGDEGAGHQDICKFIAEYFNLDYLDISDVFSKEVVDKMYLASNLTLYSIDMTKFNELNQNILLKLFEEPSAFTYMILYGESTYNILETIINRSYVLQMDSFSREYLQSLVTNGDEDVKLDVCTTPGQIEIANHTDIKKLVVLCNTIIDNMEKASFANMLTISDKINFSDQYDKFELRLFNSVLARQMLIKKKYDLYDSIVNMNKHIRFMLDKKRYFEHYLIEMWKKARGIQ